MNIPETKSQNTAQYHLRMPEKLKKRLQILAEQEQRSLNGQIIVLLEQSAERRSPDEQEEK